MINKPCVNSTEQQQPTEQAEPTKEPRKTLSRIRLDQQDEAQRIKKLASASPEQQADNENKSQVKPLTKFNMTHMDIGNKKVVQPFKKGKNDI